MDSDSEHVGGGAPCRHMKTAAVWRGPRSSVNLEPSTWEAGKAVIPTPHERKAGKVVLRHSNMVAPKRRGQQSDH